MVSLFVFFVGWSESWLQYVIVNRGFRSFSDLHHIRVRLRVVVVIVSVRWFWLVIMVNDFYVFFRFMMNFGVILLCWWVGDNNRP